jgi:hypothetical protein
VQAEVTAAEEPAATDGAGPPAVPDVTAGQEELDLPTPTPAPTVVPVNADILQAIDIPADSALEQGTAREFAYSYQVTTPRSSTTFVAEIGGSSGQTGVWTVQLHAGDLWSDVGNRVVLTDALNTGGGSTVPLSVIVTAPPSVTVDETVTIWLGSSVQRLDGGVEQGLVATQPLASVSASPPPPAPTPTPTLPPTAAPVIDPVLTCAGPADYEVQIGGEVHLTCEVTVLDSRAGAVVAIEPPSGWAVASADGVASTAPLEVGPFALDDDVATVHAVPITVQAPVAVGEEGALTIRLLQDSESRTELDSATIALTTFIPEDWQLTCSTGSTNAVPGGNVEIACELPEAAWALRGDAPTYAFSTNGGWAGDVGRVLDAAAFSFPLDLPCAIASDQEEVSVEVDLGNGLQFTAATTLPIDRSVAVPVPVLTHTDIDFGEAQWIGTSYAPAETTVTLTVTGATTACASADWGIQAIVSSFSDGQIAVDPVITYDSQNSPTKINKPESNGTLIPGSAPTVASGSGDGEVVLHLTLSMPATVGAGTFTGDVEFVISAGP